MRIKSVVNIKALLNKLLKKIKKKDSILFG